jgi:hypothetical protein
MSLEHGQRQRVVVNKINQFGRRDVNWNSLPGAPTDHFDFFPPECEFHHTGYEAFVVKSSGSSLLAPAAHTHPGRGILSPLGPLRNRR